MKKKVVYLLVLVAISCALTQVDSRRYRYGYRDGFPFTKVDRITGAVYQHRAIGYPNAEWIWVKIYPKPKEVPTKSDWPTWKWVSPVEYFKGLLVPKPKEAPIAEGPSKPPIVDPESVKANNSLACKKLLEEFTKDLRPKRKPDVFDKVACEKILEDTETAIRIGFIPEK